MEVKLLHRIWRSLRIGIILTLIFTLISTLFWIKQISWNTFFTCALISTLFSFGLGSGSSILTAFLDYKYSWATHFRNRLRIGIPITIISNALIVLLIDYIVYILLFKRPIEQFFSFEMIKIHMFYFLISMFVNTFFYAKAFLAHLKKSVQREIELERDKVLLKYDALKNQIDPHFFFNNLNVLSSLIEEDIDQSQNFIQQMTHIYRYVLSQKDKETTQIASEIEFAQQYIYLQKARFEEGVQLNINIPKQYNDTKIVVLSMQLLLENIFKHNAVSDEHPIIIEIFTEDQHLVVRNNINPKQHLAPSTRLGLENIRQRYNLLTNQEFVVLKNNTHFCVKLPLL